MSTRSNAVHVLVRAALNPEGNGRIEDLARVLADATGAEGALLWEAPDAIRGDDTLSVLAHSLGHRSAPLQRTLRADPLTQRAFTARSLALPEPGRPAGTVGGRRVAAALPIEYLDGLRGALTLLGETDLSGDGFDTAVQLVDLLPELCSAVRERQTLALVNACNSILHDADVESPTAPLSRDRLSQILSHVCSLLAERLRCPEVSIFLREPQARERGYRLLTASAGCSPASEEVTAEPVDQVRSGLAPGTEPLMEVRLMRGGVVSGLLRCRGSDGPPHHFRTSDLELLRPIATQLTRYWRSWLQRRLISDENESWRGLAAGMTSLNRLIAEKLADDRDRCHEQVAQAAALIVRDVVPEATGATVFRAHTRNGATRMVPLTGPAPRNGGSAAEQILDPSVAGWRLRVPIRVGEQVYGQLEAVGPDVEPPANSAQVYEIVADQIGLYRHLDSTLWRLQQAQQRLEDARRTEADAMEDLKHQLVSPLRTATSRAELVLASRRFDPRAEGQLKAIRGLCRKASRVAMSAGVFATLSKGEPPAPKFEPFGVDDLLRMLIAAADDAQVLGDPRRGITFEVDRGSVRALGRRLVRVDASFLQQCIGNVLDNAAKYAYRDTVVQIGATVESEVLRLCTTSIGLPLDSADLDRCLQRNWRGTAARSTTGEGSGLGLWIADNLMRAMDGRAVVSAELDRTTVRLELPVR